MVIGVRTFGNGTSGGGKLAGLFAPSRIRYTYAHFATTGKQKLIIIVIATLMAGIAVAVTFALSGADRNTTNSEQQSGGEPSGQSNSGDTNNSNARQSSDKSDGSASAGKATSSTSVTVNGQSVDVPQSGAYDETVKVPNGQVHVSGNNSSTVSGNSASNSSTSSTTVNVNSR
jgi:cytoskeletal protein RodZ